MLKRIYTRVHAPARGKARLLGLFVVLAGAATVISAFPAHQANAATSSYLNFQARLLTSTGTVVPDGNYHIEFKIYDSISSGASSQGVCSLDSSTDDCWWVETRTTGNLVRVVNGYFSVNLGSVTAFGSTIPWDQQLYLTMRIGGTGGSPSWDPEMLSSGNRMVLTGVPYAFRAAKLASFNGTQTGTLSFGAVTNSPVLTLPNETGTVCTTGSVCTGYAASSGSSSYIQNTTSLQSNANFFIQSAASGSVGGIIRGASGQSVNLFELQTNTPATVFSVGSTGAALFQNSANSTTAFQIQNAAGTSNLFIADTVNGKIGIGKVPVNGVLDINGIAAASQYYTTNGIVITNTGTSVISKQVTAGSTGFSQYDVVIFDSTASGTDKVITTTTARDSKVYGVATAAAGAGGSTYVAIAGTSTLNVDTGAVAVGDQLVTSTTAGRATTDNNATTGIIGIALSSKAGGSNGTVVVSIRPIGGQFTPRFQNSSDSTTAFQIQNAAGKNVLTADTSGGIVSLGNSGASGVTGNLKFNFTAQTGSISLVPLSPSSTAYTLNLPAENGTLCSTGSVCTGYAASSGSGSYIQNGTSTQSNANFNIQSASSSSVVATIQGTTGQTADVLKLTSPDRNSYALLINNNTFGSLDTSGFGFWQENTGQGVIDINNGRAIVLGTNQNVGIGTASGSDPAALLAVSGTGSTGSLFRVTDTTATSQNVLDIADGGATAFRNQTNSTTAFQVQNAAGTNYLGVDTVNQGVFSGRLAVGSVTGNRAFSDNFETGTYGLWNATVGTSSIDTATVFAGGYSAKVNPTASFAYREKNISGAATMYARGYVNIASTSTKVTLFSLYNSTDGFAASEITAYRQAGGNIAVYSAPLTGGAGGDCVTGGALSTGSWHKIEIKVVVSNTGSCQLTVDDGTPSTSGSVDTLATTTNPNRFSIGSHNGSETDVTYFDELSVDTQAIDNSGSLTVQDTLHAGGSATFSGAALFQNAADSSSSFQVMNVAGNTYLSVDTSGATVSVGNTGIASTVQIGNTTGAVAQTISIGNNATASSTTALTVGNLLGTSATTIQGGTGASAIAIQAGNAGTITIGSQTGSTANTINIGAAGSTTNSDNVSINNTSGTNSGTITLGGTGAASGTITIGQATTANNTISIGSGNLTAATQTITLGGGTTTTSGGLVLNLGTGVPGASTTKTIHIGDGGTTTGTVGITIGSIGAAAHTTTIQGGNGAGAVSIQAAASGSVYIGTTNSNNLFVGGNILAFAAPTGGATSQTATNVDTTGDVGIDTEIKIGGDGLGVISYYDNTNHDLKVAHCSNAACTSATTTSPDTGGDVGQYSSMAIAPDGFPIISYYDITNTALKVIKCGNADCTSGNTTTTLDSQGANNTGQYTSIAIGIDGFAVISYYYATGGDLYVKHCTNATCSTSDTATALDTTNTTGQDTSIAIGTDGYPVISYYYATGLDLKFVKCNNLSCSSFATPVSLDTAQDDGAYSTMAIGTDGYPVIAYQQGTGTVGMKVAKCLNTGCTGTPTLTIVDSSVANVGAYTSLALGQDGYPVISYKDSTNSSLRVAKCGNASCSTGNTLTTVDVDAGSPVYGNYSSLVVAADGLPLISEYDSFGSDLNLRVVKCANPACSQTTGGSITGGSNIGSVTNYFNDIYAANYYGKTFSISNFDLAEEYSVEDNSLQPGEIVALNTATGKLKRAAPGDRPNLLGVVSTKPGLALRDYEHPSDDKKLIALAGKVPLKVKGDINIGDPITISDTDGVGVKAQSGGMIVGRALENHTGDNIDSITIFVQTQQYFNICDLQGDSGIAMDINVGKLAATNLTVNGDSTFNGNITLKGHVIGNSDTAGTVTILTGQNGITYSFAKPYASAPFVVVTATSDVGNLRYWVVKTPQQFKINLSGPAPANLQFDYLVQQ